MPYPRDRSRKKFSTEPEEVGRMKGRTKIRKILTAMTFLSVLAAMGCGTYSPVAPSNESTMPGVENPQFVQIIPTSAGTNRPIHGSGIASDIISAVDGGTLTNGYYSLYFPPGALEEDTEITMEMPMYPKAVIKLGPHGIKFKKAVVLSLPTDIIDSDAESYQVLWYNEDTELWEYIGGYMDDGAVKAELEHFSEYGHQPKVNP
jgi:hypothetical protein